MFVLYLTVAGGENKGKGKGGWGMRVLVRRDHEFQLHRAQAFSFPQTAGFGMEWKEE